MWCQRFVWTRRIRRFAFVPYNGINFLLNSFFFLIFLVEYGESPVFLFFEKKMPIQISFS